MGRAYCDSGFERWGCSLLPIAVEQREREWRARHATGPTATTHAQASPSCPHYPMPCLQLVFALISVGAIALTINVVLLGGTIGFFQSLCLLGYCLFPMDVAAIVCVTVKKPLLVRSVRRQ